MLGLRALPHTRRVFKKGHPGENTTGGQQAPRKEGANHEEDPMVGSTSLSAAVIVHLGWARVNGAWRSLNANEL
jgi:hypothetical protein